MDFLKKLREKILTSSWVENSPRPENPKKWSFWSRRPFLRVIMTGIEIFPKCHRIALVTPYPVTLLKKAIFTVCSREKGRRVKYLVEPKHTVALGVSLFYLELYHHLATMWELALMVHQLRTAQLTPLFAQHGRLSIRRGHLNNNGNDSNACCTAH